ncbi:MAG: ABC transporter ATP-binding protein [Comamonas sp.]|jgi:lipopolysaccharide transport system ATP-binding protein|uniref:ABC transporter ATP-binding protein n=1 Tax=Comamonas sp. TaxID=34028 RepID=UPI002FCC5BA1
MTVQKNLTSAMLGNEVLRVSGLGKEYKLYASARQRLKGLLTGRSTHSSHWALRNVSFTLQRGQCIGVVGDNGAGKSSLLKLLAGTVQASLGTIERVGRVTAILELGAGFHPEFTGRENLYFAGSLIGIGAAQMHALEPEIVAFSELGVAMDRQVKTYSSGMTVRLAFALVTAVQPDVLIVDEALAVGDQHFQKKCIERIMAFRERGCTILFCSHSPYHIRHLCDVAMWLDAGQMQMMGETELVLAAYDEHTRQRLASEQAEAAAGAIHATQAEEPVLAQAPQGSTPVLSGSTVPASMRSGACLLSVEVKDLESEGTPRLLRSQDLVVTITASGQGDEIPHMGFMIEQSKGVGITSLATHEDGALPRQLEDGSWQLELHFPDLPLHTGDYVISAFLFDATGLVVYDEWFQFLHFRFVFPKPLPGLVRLPHFWR